MYIFWPKRKEVLEDLRTFPNADVMISTPSKENETGGACEMYGSEENYDPGFGGETQVKETTRDT